jgi:hypothetical protein
MNRTTAILAFLLSTALTASAFWVVACSSKSSGGGQPATDAGQDACPAPPNEPDCFPTPLPPDASHHMIINACTDAQAFDKHPTLSLLGPCGQLPPLP